MTKSFLIYFISAPYIPGASIHFILQLLLIQPVADDASSPYNSEESAAPINSVAADETQNLLPDHFIGVPLIDSSSSCQSIAAPTLPVKHHLLLLCE